METRLTSTGDPEDKTQRQKTKTQKETNNIKQEPDITSETLGRTKLETKR